MHSRKTRGLVLCVALAAGTSGATIAEEAATLYVEKTCASCHGPDAKTPILPVYPKLAGQTAEYTYQQLLDIKSGTRKNAMTPAMYGIMQNVSEEEMRILADWIAGLPAN